MDLTNMGEKEITSEDKNNKKLSIQVSLNGLSFCILNQQEKKIVYFKKINFEKQLDPIKVLSQIELTYENETELVKLIHDHFPEGFFVKEDL